jgi:hypothetical protein
LNKTEVKQTKQIVKTAIKKEHALKYFHSQDSDNALSPTVSGVSNRNQVSVVAFSSTTEFDNNSAAEFYGTQELQPLYLARPFKPTSGDALKEQALNGQNCIPKIARSTFSIERVAYAVAHAQGGTTNPTPNMARSLPIGYRIIKVGYKPSAGTQQTNNLSLDMFLDTAGQACGIDSDNFDRMDCQYAAINTKKYTKIMDVHGVLHQNNIITPSDFAGQLTDIVTGKPGICYKHMTVPFQLSQRKNGKLFYDESTAPGTKTFTSGGKRELVLFHFWYLNGHTLLGAEGQPQAPTSDDIQIKSRNLSAFVDAN